MTYFFDVDGTLTKTQRPKWAEPNMEMIAACKGLIKEGHNVVVWTSTARYARRFCAKYGIEPLLAIGKPQVIIDNEKKKWGNRFKNRTVTPEEFLKGLKNEC